MKRHIAKTASYGLRIALSGGILLCTAPAYAGDNDRVQNHLSGVNTAHLQNVHHMSFGHDLTDTAFATQSDPGIGLGLSYNIKFGEHVRKSEKYGTAGLTFNSSWQGRTAFTPLAEMSFGQLDR